ncbi:hypothetical protein BT63DRAFT_191717 [Microthyrium microscopicum]|uniref:BTB domain transcription factor n=1 Tax=Microthyrium microscopicum TaxID=703497 RepID=A0A6A6UJ17_9PEZI|nr:hypothetical protein BT63DRAFT_191717 [Microthyrium microscopicum]
MVELRVRKAKPGEQSKLVPAKRQKKDDKAADEPVKRQKKDDKPAKKQTKSEMETDEPAKSKLTQKEKATKPAASKPSVSKSKPTKQKPDAKSNDEQTPTSTLIEKGVVYFFTRSRVDLENPHSVKDLQRSYFVLRPIPQDVKLEDELKKDNGNSRLFALPKKVFPKHHNEKYMAFVEKGAATVADLRENFFPGSEYTTQTSGTRHQQPIMPVAEGVYSITQIERTSYLTYYLTIPSEIDEVQRELGLQSKGSFQVSVKNPERKGPAQARLPEKAKYPKELLDEFGNYAWIPVQKPELLDYDNAQVLLIGHGDETSQAENAAPSPGNGEKEEEEDLGDLADEDAHRVHKISGDDTIFDDLKISHKEYPEVASTW